MRAAREPRRLQTAPGVAAPFALVRRTAFGAGTHGLQPRALGRGWHRVTLAWSKLEGTAGDRGVMGLVAGTGRGETVGSCLEIQVWSWIVPD